MKDIIIDILKVVWNLVLIFIFISTTVYYLWFKEVITNKDIIAYLLYCVTYLQITLNSD